MRLVLAQSAELSRHCGAVLTQPLGSGERWGVIQALWALQVLHLGQEGLVQLD